MKLHKSNGRAADETTIARVPAVEIEPEAYAKLLTYVTGCAVELSGLGTVDYADGALVVRDVYLLPQKASSATTEIEEEDVAEFLQEFIRSGGDPQRLRLHWHSHGPNAVFWSAVDEGQQLAGFPQAEWSVYLVLNHAGDTRACLQVRGPVAGRYDRLPITLHLPADVRAALIAEIEEKVQLVSYVSWHRTEQGYWALRDEDETMPPGDYCKEPSDYDTVESSAGYECEPGLDDGCEHDESAYDEADDEDEWRRTSHYQ